MDRARIAPHTLPDPVRITNRNGNSPFIFICDHASNFIPDEFAGLGLGRADLTRHIAWDPGAAPVAQRMAGALDAVLVEARISRLVIDCNRAQDAPDLIPTVSETTPIPGNARLTDAQRERRLEFVYRPFHAAVAGVIAARLAAGRSARVVSVHSFTQVYKRSVRPWHVGVIHDEDERLARPLIDALARLNGIAVGVNQPYSPGDGVYFTLETHARARGLPCAMIEIRNDELAATAGQRKWADLLTGIFLDLEPSLGPVKSRPSVANDAAAPAN